MCCVFCSPQWQHISSHSQGDDSPRLMTAIHHALLPCGAAAAGSPSGISPAAGGHFKGIPTDDVACWTSNGQRCKQKLDDRRDNNAAKQSLCARSSQAAPDVPPGAAFPADAAAVQPHNTAAGTCGTGACWVVREQLLSVISLTCLELPGKQLWLSSQQATGSQPAWSRGASQRWGTRADGPGRCQRCCSG